jgi:hypothetical protein
MSIANAKEGEAPAVDTVRWDVSPELLSRVLIPYRDNCKYLKRCSMEYRPVGDGVTEEESVASVVATADLAIGESCYIDSTGHFNAVEFQICANQIMYVMGAETARLQLVRSGASLDLAGYYERQLPNVLITNVTAAFRKLMNPRRFHGRIQLDRAYSLRDRVFWEATVTYYDDEGGLADGNIVITVGLGDKLAPKE